MKQVRQSKTLALRFVTQGASWLLSAGLVP